MADIEPEPDDLATGGYIAPNAALWVPYPPTETDVDWDAVPPGFTMCHPDTAHLYDQATEPGPLRTFWRLMVRTHRAVRARRDAR